MRKQRGATRDQLATRARLFGLAGRARTVAALDLLLRCPEWNDRHVWFDMTPEMQDVAVLMLNSYFEIAGGPMWWIEEDSDVFGFNELTEPRFYAHTFAGVRYLVATPGFCGMAPDVASIPILSTLMFLRHPPVFLPLDTVIYRMED